MPFCGGFRPFGTSSACRFPAARSDRSGNRAPTSQRPPEGRNETNLEPIRMKIAFLITRPSKPSYRFRIEQMLPYFTARRPQCDTFFLPTNAWRRLLMYRKLGPYDAVVLQKRLLSRMELFVLRSMARRLVYDVDDAVMYTSNGEDHSRRRRRFATTVRTADLVVCGNQFLADEASRDTDRILVVPTCINTDAYRPGLRTDHAKALTIG